MKSDVLRTLIRPGATGSPVRRGLIAAALTIAIGLGFGPASIAASSSNPLELRPAPTNGNPLSGARFFVDHGNSVSAAARQYPGLRVIADEPGTARFGGFSGPDVGAVVHALLVRAAHQEPGTIPLLATYRVVDGHCGHYTPTPADEASYHRFIESFARGIGRHRAVLFLEIDALITAPCLSSQGVTVRMRELHGAIDTLTAHCPHLVIYLDAGAADALSAAHTATLLRRAGVGQIQGFFLNSTHFDWTSREIAYGEQVSRMTGGKHFVVNTGDNGRGPLIPPDRVHQGNEVLCNPSGRGLGPKPTTDTGYRNLDAFAWTTNPGESGGQCVPGAPPVGAYWPAYGLMLVRNADFAVDKTPPVAPHRRRRRRR
ncbi:MAG: glycoside hydrolase family 6 protein [Candidatus Woesearchaeota archaeon]